MTTVEQRRKKNRASASPPVKNILRSFSKSWGCQTVGVRNCICVCMCICIETSSSLPSPKITNPQIARSGYCQRPLEYSFSLHTAEATLVHTKAHSVAQPVTRSPIQLAAAASAIYLFLALFGVCYTLYFMYICMYACMYICTYIYSFFGLITTFAC